MELILEPKKEDFVVKEYYDANMIRKQKIMAHVHVCMHISENQLFLIFFSYFDHKFYYVNIWVKNVFKYIITYRDPNPIKIIISLSIISMEINTLRSNIVFNDVIILSIHFSANYLKSMHLLITLGF